MLGVRALRLYWGLHKLRDSGRALALTVHWGVRDIVDAICMSWGDGALCEFWGFHGLIVSWFHALSVPGRVYVLNVSVIVLGLRVSGGVHGVRVPWGHYLCVSRGSHLLRGSPGV